MLMVNFDFNVVFVSKSAVFRRFSFADFFIFNFEKVIIVKIIIFNF